MRGERIAAVGPNPALLRERSALGAIVPAAFGAGVEAQVSQAFVGPLLMFVSGSSGVVSPVSVKTN